MEVADGHFELIVKNLRTAVQFKHAQKIVYSKTRLDDTILQNCSHFQYNLIAN